MNRRQLGQHAGQGLVFSVFGPGFGGGAGAAPNVTLENGTALVSTDGGNALVSGSDGGALLTGGSIRASLDSTLGGTFWRVPASDPLLAYDAGAREISIVGGNAVTLPVASTSEAGLFSAEDKRATALARTTRAAITSENVPAAVTAFRTTGYTSAGDGGGALYLRVGAEPAHAGKVQSGDGAWWELQPDPYLNARQIGAQGDDTTDDTLAIKDWLDTAVALGAPAFLPDGVYLMQTGIDVLLSASLSVTCARDATLKAGAIDRVLLRITSPDTDPSAFFSLLWQGGIFDTSQALFGIGEGAGSGLQPRRLNNVVIRDATFTTRTPRDATPLRGDSGITSVEVFSMLIEGCRFFGHPDAGVYLSGGASSSTDDDGGFTKILSCDFEECVSAITVKRQARET
ncbi:MAG: glycosyl hydrolase family 28-related protein, partial [Pseudomonadota bacterium]